MSSALAHATSLAGSLVHHTASSLVGNANVAGSSSAAASSGSGSSSGSSSAASSSSASSSSKGAAANVAHPAYVGENPNKKFALLFGGILGVSALLSSL